MDWSSWIQELGKTAVDVYGAKEQRDYDIQRLRLQEDTAAAQAAAARFQALGVGGAASLSPTIMIAGAVALVGLLMLAGKE